MTDDIMIKIENVSFRHHSADTESVRDVSITVRRGECVLLTGTSGSGKTTVTRLINGLIPHYYEGELKGEVHVASLDVTGAELYETARFVGSVFQNPRSQFFCVDTTSELAFGCENYGMPAEEILERIQRVAKELKITHLMDKNIFGLSGGEKQKIACGSVTAMTPEVFVLDEPTSNLDLDAIEDLRELLSVWKRAGKTIVIAEHRLYWVRELCDRVIGMKDGRVSFDIPMQEFTAYSEADFRHMGLRSINESVRMPACAKTKGDVQGTDKTWTLVLKDFVYAYDKTDAIGIKELTVPQGSIVAVVGKNGAGKTTLAKCLCGIQKKFNGTVEICGEDGNLENRLRRKRLMDKTYMVMQDVNHQLFCETVDEEVRLGMSNENADKVDAVLEELNLTELTDRHPMAISGGQKQRVAIASAILAGKEILVFDEPTSGLDYLHMEKTAELISSLRDGRTVFIITHDPALVRACCTHLLELENGRVKLFGAIQEF